MSQPRDLFVQVAIGFKYLCAKFHYLTMIAIVTIQIKPTPYISNTL